ncbi:amidohydrolase family protein, partial [Salmonella enterica subsp. enterica serovar Anatum]|nr:amidohydrolase family protein [Salmonella enterica subsp. enterica serovar Anatum]
VFRLTPFVMVGVMLTIATALPVVTVGSPLPQLGDLITLIYLFVAIGMSLPQVIACVTANAADSLNLKTKGRLQPGLDADLTLFTL